MKNENRKWEILLYSTDIADLEAGKARHWSKRIDGKLYTIEAKYGGIA